MNETISAFPSDALYGSELINHESVAKRRLIDLPSITDPTSEDAQDTLGSTLVFFDTAGSEMYERLEGDGEDGSVAKGKIGEGSRYNENEAEIISKWVRKLVSRGTDVPRATLAFAYVSRQQVALGVPEYEIAIITPYQAQVAHIASMLREEFPALLCGSVDGMQGQEREASCKAWSSAYGAQLMFRVRIGGHLELGTKQCYKRGWVLGREKTAQRSHDQGQATTGEPEYGAQLSISSRSTLLQCVVGDSSTVSQGSKYLKSWMDHLEEHADVRFALDEM
jgi:DNA polymerase alpha-associated DNA helicase A